MFNPVQFANVLLCPRAQMSEGAAAHLSERAD